MVPALLPDSGRMKKAVDAMSFAVFQQLAPTALVDRSIFASFTCSNVNDLVARH